VTIFGISIVRNEADILRVNVLHHLALGIDRFLIVDNGSSDGTDRVLRELGADRRIRWTRDDGPYRQSEITTELARQAVREGARWVLPIDADEFWWASGGDLRRLLDDSAAGALRAQVLNFVQRRDQVDNTPEALLSMTKRAPLPIGPLERVRERVESGRFAYVEMMYQPKWIFRPAASVEVAMGNHAVAGVEGPEMDTGEIVCFHALLRSRAALGAKVEQGRRVEELGLDPDQSWHARRWKRISESGDLEREWRANSYEGDFLDVYGLPHRVVFDPRLRNLVAPWISSAAEKKRGAASISPSESGGRRPPRSRAEIDGSAEEEVARLLETVHEQMATHVAQEMASEASLRREVGSRDKILGALTTELHEKVDERDRLIRATQEELHGKVGERDGMIRELQAELHSKVNERDRIIREQRSRIETLEKGAGSQRDTAGAFFGTVPAQLAATGRELAQATAEIIEHLRLLKEKELDRQARLEEELKTVLGRLESQLKRREALEKQLQEVQHELQRQAGLEKRLRSAEMELGRQEGERRSIQEKLAATEQSLRSAEVELGRLRPLEAELSRSGEDLAARARELSAARVDLAAAVSRGEAARTGELAASEELVRIHRSRLWKAACIYWRTIGWLRGGGSDADRSRPAEDLAAEGVSSRPEVPAGAAVGAAEPVPGSEPEAPPVRVEADAELASDPAPAEPVDAPSGTSVPPDSAPTAVAAVDVLNPNFAWGNRFDVVCLPIIDWNFRFQRPQQLMCRFADAGHRVFYVAPWIRTSGPQYEIARLRPNVYELSMRGAELDVYTDLLDDAALNSLVESLEAVRRDYGLGATVVVVQLPFWSRLASTLQKKLAWPVVYDCMDHHAGFSTNHEEMLAQENRLLEGADLVTTTSASLEERASEFNPNVLLLRNGCDFDHFAGAASRHGARPVIGYYGAIADWFDSDLVADLAERRREWDFVLVGDTFTADVERLRTLPNVRLVGEQPYSEIPQWLRGFDVAILPFKRIPLTEATNPVKAYEILAAGKPLVSVPLPEVVLLGPLVRLASDAAEFDVQIASALETSDWGSVAERRSFARENTWELRWATLSPRVRSVFPKVSIVVVTYNNLDLTRQCLESLYARTEWPNFEVIVVDNASSDATPDYLREAATSYPELKLFLNPENVGFARACNAGLREASGEYFVLLNNDTVLTRGWLTSLIRHLHADSRIGMIGSVTNAIGNEAMVPVGYEDVERMPQWAASFVRDHDGEVFDIPMLAMFCVALRRSVFEIVGPLDERFGVGLFEDDDYSLRVRQAEYRVVCAQDSFVHHWMRAAFAQIPPAEYQRLFERNRRLFEEKWGTVWVVHGGRTEKRAGEPNDVRGGSGGPALSSGGSAEPYSEVRMAEGQME